MSTHTRPFLKAATGATFARGASKQDYSTPPEFIAAVKRHFGLKAFDFDLAASSKNTKAKKFFDVRADALKQDWTRLHGHLWINPPFGDIAPWAAKCASAGTGSASRQRWIYLLVPAAVGSNWFRDHVYLKARVYFLNGRLSFDGKNPYPKDCMLAVYGEVSGHEVWSWKEDAGT